MPDGARPKERVTSLVRPHLLAMPGYEPVEPVHVMARRLGLSESQIVKLDGNENPYGPSPLVREALARFSSYHIYPDPAQWEVRQAVAEYAGVDAEQVVLGSGSDEILNIAAHLFLDPGDVVVNAPPTFGMYDFIGRTMNARLVEAPRLEDFELDMPALEAALAGGAKLLFLASPNNPTGNPLRRRDLERLLDYRAVVVVDEAYAEFAGETAADMVAEHENLIVVRTFSKWAGLAGLRVGYGIFPPALVPVLWSTKIPYNLSVAAEQAVLASLSDRERLLANVRLIREERERMAALLRELGWLHPYPSAGNFLLCRVREIPARAVRDGLRRRGVLVRYFDAPGLQDCLRISVGKPEHTDRLIEALREVKAEYRG
jgi:histidinol-phosphate aminotransferase